MKLHTISYRTNHDKNYCSSPAHPFGYLFFSPVDVGEQSAIDQRSGVHAVDNDGATDHPDVRPNVYHNFAVPSLFRNLKKRPFENRSPRKQHTLHIDADHRSGADVLKLPLCEPKLRDADHNYHERRHGCGICHTRSS